MIRRLLLSFAAALCAARASAAPPDLARFQRPDSVAPAPDSARRAPDSLVSLRVPDFRPTPLFTWGPPPEGTPHPERARSYDLQHQVVRVRFDWPRHAVVGSTTIRFAALDKRLSTVSLDAVGMSGLKVRTAAGKPLKFAYDGKTLTVTLATALPAHARTSLTIEYEVVSPKKGAYFIDRKHIVWTQGEAEDTRYWIPTWDSPNDRTTWEMYIRTAANEKALSNGKLADSRRVGGEVEWHWVQDRSAATYLMTAVTGEFTVLQDVWHGIPVGYWTYPDSVQAAWRGFGRTPRLMELFSTKLGVPYPWVKYDQVVVPDYIFGGMENVTATTQNDNDILHPAWAEPQASSFILVAHELAHQWTGDYVTARDWSHIWLSEGFATLLEQVAVESELGADEGAVERQSAMETALEADLQSRRPLVYDRWVDGPIELFLTGHVYQKGGLVLQLLRHQLGDSLFWSGMREYLHSRALGTAVTEDFQRAMERASGRDLEVFFRQWVFGAGFPAVQVSADYDAAAMRLQVSAKQVQPVDTVTEFFEVQVDVEVLTDSGTSRMVLPMKRGIGQAALRLPAAPRAMRFNAGGWIPAMVDFPRATVMVVYQLEHDGDVLGRIEAVDLLSERGGEPMAVSALARAVRGDRLWAVRTRAAAALGLLVATDEARQALLDATGDADSRVRQAAVIGLRGAKGAGIAERMAALQSDSSRYVRGAALGTLAVVDTGAALAAIRTALGQESWTDLERAHAVTALRLIPGQESWTLTARWLAPGTVAGTREAAIRSLMGRVHLMQREAELAGLLAPLLDAGELGTRLTAAQALGALGQAASVPVLEARRAVEADDLVRAAIDQALATLKRPTER
jgi:aminopeptidase N